MVRGQQGTVRGHWGTVRDHEEQGMATRDNEGTVRWDHPIPAVPSVSAVPAVPTAPMSPLSLPSPMSLLSPLSPLSHVPVSPDRVSGSGGCPMALVAAGSGPWPRCHSCPAHSSCRCPLSPPRVPTCAGEGTVVTQCHPGWGGDSSHTVSPRAGERIAVTRCHPGWGGDSGHPVPLGPGRGQRSHNATKGQGEDSSHTVPPGPGRGQWSHDATRVRERTAVSPQCHPSRDVTAVSRQCHLAGEVAAVSPQCHRAREVTALSPQCHSRVPSLAEGAGLVQRVRALLSRCHLQVTCDVDLWGQDIGTSVTIGTY